MKFGVQNSVVAWDDPWHLQSCKTMMRTGERRYFPSQDIAPSKSEFLRFVREELGADFIMQHVMPVDSEIETLIDDLAAAEIPFMLGNEFGNANRVRTPGTNRYDIPLRLVEKAQRTGWFMGLQYDETEHLQMNNLIYDPDAAGLYQWVNPQGKTLAEMEEGFVDSVSNCGDFPDTVRKNLPTVWSWVIIFRPIFFSSRTAIRWPAVRKKESNCWNTGEFTEIFWRAAGVRLRLMPHRMRGAKSPSSVLRTASLPRTELFSTPVRMERCTSKTTVRPTAFLTSCTCSPTGRCPIPAVRSTICRGCPIRALSVRTRRYAPSRKRMGWQGEETSSFKKGPGA